MTTQRKNTYPFLLAGTVLATLLNCRGALAAWEFTPRVNIEYVNGETTESVYYAYPNGGKVSELDWNLSSLFRINFGATVQPADWIRLNIDYAFKIDDGDADMTDYDWFYPFYDWSHQSSHSDTVINKANRFDVSADFPLIRAKQLLFTGGIGYRIDDWEWEGRGGTYIYSSADFRDDVGTFPDGEKGITYGHTISSFFVSLGADAEFDRFSVGARVLYSPESQVDTEDTHHMRDLVFSEDFEDTTMLSVEIAGSWHINPRLSIIGAYSYTHYDEVKGYTTITDSQTGQSLVDSETRGGFENSSNVFSIGVSYRF